ncbi:response regulator [Peredibacter starrii]|uniref:Response regulator n=1 Tax=Peredibacter starrii TaxID=28202 RepID=A0AAX4HL31_9BACT|nr:response regulator [Peredibacter starrii]WPU63974.1 response regulator [Peredibacter starrii]
MKKGNLLIVDDEPILLETLKYNLSDLAEKIFLAINGKMALEIIKRESIQCILCDINMPVMNGVELVKNIRALGLETPLIFYTGHGNHDLMLEAVKYGAFDFINKPALDHIEEVVERGLQVGRGDHQESKSDFMSEYRKLLASQ